MTERTHYNQLEVDTIHRLREVYAKNDSYIVPLKSMNDKERLSRLAYDALFPEVPEIDFEAGQTEENFEEAEQSLSEIRQKDALLFHLSAQIPGKKNIVRLISCGGVDDGKSTVIGRILYEAATEEDRKKICKRIEGTNFRARNV